MRFVIVAFTAAFLTGCAAGISSVSPVELEEITARVYAADYDRTFNAAMLTIEQSGLVVENADRSSGFINSEYESVDNALATALIGNIRRRVTMTIRKIDEGHTRVKINLTAENQFDGAWKKLDLRKSEVKERSGEWLDAVASNIAPPVLRMIPR